MENTETLKPITHFNLNNGTKFVIQGSLSEDITNLLLQEYQKESDSVTGLVLESQVMMNIQKATKFVEENTASLLLKDDHVGVLYAVNNKDAVKDDLAELASLVSTMDNSQVRNTAVIINKPENEEVQVMSSAIESFCKQVNVKVYYSLKSFMGNKKVI